jgi:rubrerythrin
MGDGFSVDDIFEIAVRMEVNGGDFYRRAAADAPDAAGRKLLLDLAAMENEHEAIFRAMRSALPHTTKPSPRNDPNRQAEGFLTALVEARAFFDNEIDTSSMAEILKAAITAEKEAIVFYLGMKDLVSVSSGKDKIQAIIKEEMRHVRLLSTELVKISGPRV